MNGTNLLAGFGTLFPMRAARTVPAQEFLTRGPAPRTSVREPSAGAGIGRGLRALVQAFERHRERARVRQSLARLDDRLLRDIGLNRADVELEIGPPFVGLGEPLADGPGAGRGVAPRVTRVGLWHL
jgi:uncharacterized protein YjiS (DUF1127 family)